MILLWFILGIALIFGIARYNESNKLFWTLLFSFIMGFAGTKMILDIHHGDKQSNVSLMQVHSTQVPVTTLSTLSYYTTDVVLQNDNVVTAQQLVGQSIAPALNEINVIRGEIFERTRDQPQLNIIKLREPYLIAHLFDTS